MKSLRDYESTKEYKIVLIGDAAVGKTCLLSVYSMGDFPMKYIPTIMEIIDKIIVLGQCRCKLQLWDTAGLEEYSVMRRVSYEGAHCFVICFQVDSLESLNNAKLVWEKEVRSLGYTGTPIILVGTKSDFRKNPKKKCLGQEVIEKVRKDLDAFMYIETSAMENKNVSEVFEEISKHLFGEKERNLKEKLKSESGKFSVGKGVRSTVQAFKKMGRRTSGTGIRISGGVKVAQQLHKLTALYNIPSDSDEDD